MRKYILFICLIFVSCSQTYLEETQNAVSINTKVSYDTLDTGILIEWDAQWDFARVEIFKGTDANELSVFKDDLAQNTWLDVDNIPGQDYYYKIKAYNSKNRIIGQSDVYKGRRSYRSYEQMTAPSNLTTYFAKYTDKIEIYWVANNLDVFKIYRSETLVGTPTKIAQLCFGALEELKYVDEDVEPGTSYFYTVSSIGKNLDGMVVERMSTPLEGSTKIAPKGAVTSTLMGGITVSWDSDTITEYYQVYRSETEEGEYKLVVPFIVETQYTDKNLPNLTGTTDTEGTYAYPLYYYKIKGFSGGQESGLSPAIAGYAIDPADILPAPTSLDVVVDNSSYPYYLDLSWGAPEFINERDVTYRLSKISGNETNHIITTTLLTHRMPDEALNSQWQYIVQTINNTAQLDGEIVSKDYISTTPTPPTLLTITTNARTSITNMEVTIDDPATHKNFDVYLKWKSWGKWKYDDYVAGTVKKEWVTKSTVGNIDLTWDKNPSEVVDFYTIFRKKQGDDTAEFVEVATITDGETLTYSDFNFIDDEYKGSLVEGTFAYPMYEYKMTATSGGKESASSLILAGSAINPKDILPAPSYLTIPGHWADYMGFGSSQWIEGTKSPKGIDKIKNKGYVGSQTDGNHLFLTWGDVDNATTYRVRHSRGSEQKNWINKSDYPIINASVQYKNDTINENQTGLYVFSDFTGYTKNNASFDVAPVNGNAGNLLGEVRGIWFEEPNSNPY